MYEKEKTRKYRNDPTKLANWFYDEKDDYYLDQNGVRFVILRFMKQMSSN